MPTNTPGPNRTQLLEITHTSDALLECHDPPVLQLLSPAQAISSSSMHTPLDTRPSRTHRQLGQALTLALLTFGRSLDAADIHTLSDQSPTPPTAPRRPGGLVIRSTIEFGSEAAVALAASKEISAYLQVISQPVAFPTSRPQQIAPRVITALGELMRQQNALRTATTNEAAIKQSILDTLTSIGLLPLEPKPTVANYNKHLWEAPQRAAQIGILLFPDILAPSGTERITEVRAALTPFKIEQASPHKFLDPRSNTHETRTLVRVANLEGLNYTRLTLLPPFGSPFTEGMCGALIQHPAAQKQALLSMEQWQKREQAQGLLNPEQRAQLGRLPFIEETRALLLRDLALSALQHSKIAEAARGPVLGFDAQAALAFAYPSQPLSVQLTPEMLTEAGIRRVVADVRAPALASGILAWMQYASAGSGALTWGTLAHALHERNALSDPTLVAAADLLLRRSMAYIAAHPQDFGLPQRSPPVPAPDAISGLTAVATNAQRCAEFARALSSTNTRRVTITPPTTSTEGEVSGSFWKRNADWIIGAAAGVGLWLIGHLTREAAKARFRSQRVEEGLQILFHHLPETTKIVADLQRGTSRPDLLRRSQGCDSILKAAENLCFLEAGQARTVLGVLALLRDEGLFKAEQRRPLEQSLQKLARFFEGTAETPRSNRGTSRTRFLTGLSSIRRELREQGTPVSLEEVPPQVLADSRSRHLAARTALRRGLDSLCANANSFASEMERLAPQLQEQTASGMLLNIAVTHKLSDFSELENQNLACCCCRSKVATLGNSADALAKLRKEAETTQSELARLGQAVRACREALDTARELHAINDELSQALEQRIRAFEALVVYHQPTLQMLKALASSGYCFPASEAQALARVSRYLEQADEILLAKASAAEQARLHASRSQSREQGGKTGSVERDPELEQRQRELEELQLRTELVSAIYAGQEPELLRDIGGRRLKSVYDRVMGATLHRDRGEAKQILLSHPRIFTFEDKILAAYLTELQALTRWRIQHPDQARDYSPFSKDGAFATAESLRQLIASLPTTAAASV